MLAEIPSGQFQVPDNALWNIAGYVLTVLIAGLSGYRWGLKSQIFAKILEVKTAMLPMIEKFRIRASHEYIGNWHGLRPDSIGELRDPAIKLKSLLTGRKRKLLIEAWERFSATTPDEFHIPQPDEKGDKTEKMRELISSRLNSLKDAIEDC
jgi:hypothetical protein